MTTVVRALYDFDSSDSSSLKFKKGEIIQVIDQQSSGWWDGLCNGERGWFPSNFVHTLEPRKSEASSLDEDDLLTKSTEESIEPTPPEMKTTRSFSVGTVGTADDIQLPEHWTIQTSDDGAFWYYNPVTKEARWSYPGTPPNQEAIDNEDGSSENIHSTELSSRSNADTFYRKYVMTGDEQLPPNWGQKEHVDGRTYYFNMVTDQTAWKLSDVDWDTGLLRASNQNELKRGSMASASSSESSMTGDSSWSRAIAAKHNPSRRPSGLMESIEEFDDCGELSWIRLSSKVVTTIHRLNNSAKRNLKEHFIEQTSDIIEAVRVMFVCSQTENMDSQVLNGHPILAMHHQQIFSSLCKLVESAQLASSLWPAPSSVSDMQQDANDLLLAVRHFATVAQASSIPVKNLLNVDSLEDYETEGSINGGSTVDSDTIGDGSSNMDTFIDKPSYSSDIRSELATCSRITANSMKKLTQYLSTSNVKLDQLVGLTKQAIIDIAQPLTLADNVSVSGVDEKVARGFRESKQSIYNNIALLVLITQKSAEPTVPSSIVEQLVDCGRQIEASVTDLIVAVKFVINEKEKVERAMLIEKYNSLNPFDSTSSPLKQRRAVSLSLVEDDADIGDDKEHLNLKTPALLSPTNDYGSDDDEFDTKEEDLDDNEREAPVKSKQKEKLKKFFGDDAPNLMIEKNPTEEKPWFLGYEYAQADVAFNMEGQVKGGTLVSLVERLTLHDLLDSAFIATFLLTYRSFSSTEDVFELLFQRFNLQPPSGLSDPEFELWKEKKLVPVRLRVFNVIKSWLESYYLEGEDYSALEMLRDFAEANMMDILPFAAKQLLKLIDKRMQSSFDGSFRKMVLNMNKEAPPPILPKNLKRLRLLEIDPIELARQFTVMDSAMYNRIRPVECLNKAWSQKDGSIAVNIKAMIEVSNQVTNWVAETILSENEPRKRVALIKHFISIGERCRQLNNYNTLTAVLAGFNSAPIHRLRRTWELVNSKSTATLDSLKKLMSSTRNFGVYRDELHSVNPPCVPFLGLYLTDLTFVEDGNPDHVPNHPHLINIAKRAKCAEVIREIQQYQNSPYNLTPVPELQNFIRTCLQGSRDVQDLYNTSLSMEPREREDEKIARLLHESGFL
ncbi:ras GEF [Basidiobolus meristosporus CBS 931.73]|uniref:Ras GEF n=1 Tax=Basidiobolus meristosporus CBS 931.73 TaxID=1314790 RepID=A0A1Y1Y4U8_9FUNG|nr:ras GEF [Basidiobolus meristosporus CBS 931.73]|eukprot:ORX93040.1 ras GEF [Basidiobolus meristosporus CBS 931.73]